MQCWYLTDQKSYVLSVTGAANYSSILLTVQFGVAWLALCLVTWQQRKSCDDVEHFAAQGFEHCSNGRPPWENKEPSTQSTISAHQSHQSAAKHFKTTGITLEKNSKVATNGKILILIMSLQEIALVICHTLFKAQKYTYLKCLRHFHLLSLISEPLKFLNWIWTVWIPLVSQREKVCTLHWILRALLYWLH